VWISIVNGIVTVALRCTVHELFQDSISGVYIILFKLFILLIYLFDSDRDSRYKNDRQIKENNENSNNNRNDRD
jgi:hypothetical protein